MLQLPGVSTATGPGLFDAVLLARFIHEQIRSHGDTGVLHVNMSRKYQGIGMMKRL